MDSSRMGMVSHSYDLILLSYIPKRFSSQPSLGKAESTITTQEDGILSLTARSVIVPQITD